MRLDIRLSLKSVPELQSLRPEIQRRIWKDAVRDTRALRRWQLWTPGIICIVVEAIMLLRPTPKTILLGTFYIYFTLSLAPGIAAIVWFNLLSRLACPHLRRRVDQELGPRCWECGYDLRATPDLCPECGTVPEKTQISN